MKRPNGHWHVRYWVDNHKIDESARTKSDWTADAYRVRREIDINIDAGIEPMQHAEVGGLARIFVGTNDRRRRPVA